MNLRVRAALVAAACVVALTGCVKVDADLKVSSDETISGKMLLGVDKKLATQGGQTIEKTRESIEKSLKETTTDGVKCKAFEDDKWVGSECQLDNVPFSEMAGGGDSGIKLSKEGDRFTIAAGEAGGEIPKMPEGTPAADVKFKITMPGKIVEHDDGAKVDGRSATYTDASKIGGIRLVSEGSGGGFPIWAIILVALVVLAGIGAGLFFFLKGRKPAGGGQFPGQQWGGPGQGQQPGQWGPQGPGQGQQPGQWGPQPGQQGPQQPGQQWGQPGQQPPGPQQPGQQQPGQPPQQWGGQPGQPQRPQGPPPQQPGQQPPQQWGQQPPQQGQPGQWGQQGPGGPPR